MLEGELGFCSGGSRRTTEYSIACDRSSVNRPSRSHISSEHDEVYSVIDVDRKSRRLPDAS